MLIPYGVKLPQFNYHLIVIAIYICVCIYFFLFSHSPASNFVFSKKYLSQFLIISVLAFVSLFVVNKILSYGHIGINPENWVKISLTILYSIIFAVSEEIIFRGIIAKNLESHLHNILLAILISALIFGAAHLLNGALGFWPPSLWDWKLASITGVAGIFLAWLYFSSGSLVLPIILHAMLIITNQVFIKS